MTEIRVLCIPLKINDGGGSQFEGLKSFEHRLSVPEKPVFPLGVWTKVWTHFLTSLIFTNHGCSNGVTPSFTTTSLDLNRGDGLVVDLATRWSLNHPRRKGVRWWGRLSELDWVLPSYPSHRPMQNHSHWSANWPVKRSQQSRFSWLNALMCPSRECWSRTGRPWEHSRQVNPMGTEVCGGPSRTEPTRYLEPQSSSRTTNTGTHIDASQVHQRRTGFCLSGLHLHFGTGGTHQHLVTTGRTETSSSHLRGSGPSLIDVLVVELFADKRDFESDTQKKEGWNPLPESLNDASSILNKNVITTGSRAINRPIFSPPLDEQWIERSIGCIVSLQNLLIVPFILSRIQPSLLNTQVVDGIHTIQPPKKLLRWEMSSLKFDARQISHVFQK